MFCRQEATVLMLVINLRYPFRFPRGKERKKWRKGKVLNCSSLPPVLAILCVSTIDCPGKRSCDSLVIIFGRKEREIQPARLKRERNLGRKTHFPSEFFSHRVDNLVKAYAL